MAFAILLSVVLPLVFVTPGSSQAEKKATDVRGYRLAALELAGATTFPREKLVAEFPIRVGDPFDVSLVKAGLERIRHLFEDAGYIDFSYTPSTDIDHDARTYSLSFDLWQGRQYIIHRITFVGSSPLRDSELRSAMSDLGLEEGKIFRPSLLIAAVKTLNKLFGAKCLTPKDCEFTRTSDSPGAVDIRISLPPRTP